MFSVNDVVGCRDVVNIKKCKIFEKMCVEGSYANILSFKILTLGGCTGQPHFSLSKV